jgi:hypothetical protein
VLWDCFSFTDFQKVFVHIFCRHNLWMLWILTTYIQDIFSLWPINKMGLKISETPSNSCIIVFKVWLLYLIGRDLDFVTKTWDSLLDCLSQHRSGERVLLVEVCNYKGNIS